MYSPLAPATQHPYNASFMKQRTTAQMVQAAIHARSIQPNIAVLSKQGQHLKSVRESLAQIQEYDPIEFLGMLVRGEPIPSYQIDAKGVITVTYEKTAIKDRRQAAQFMAAKILPTIVAHKILPSSPDDPENENESAEQFFKDMVTKAVRRSDGEA